MNTEMNTERAIEALTWIKDKLIISAEYKKALDMAVKALSAERTGEWIDRGQCQVDEDGDTE